MSALIVSISSFRNYTNSFIFCWSLFFKLSNFDNPMSNASETESHPFSNTSPRQCKRGIEGKGSRHYTSNSQPSAHKSNAKLRNGSNGVDPSLSLNFIFAASLFFKNILSLRCPDFEILFSIFERIQILRIHIEICFKECVCISILILNASYIL